MGKIIKNYMYCQGGVLTEKGGKAGSVLIVTHRI